MSGLNANLKPETPQSSPFPVIETGIGYRVSGVGEKKQNSPFPVSVANGVGKGIGGLGLLTAGCGLIKEKVRSVTGPEVAAFPPLPKDVEAVKKAVLVLNRVAFGPRPGDVARVIQMGVTAYLEEQLADKMEEDPAVNWRVNNSEVHEMEESEPDYLSSMPDDQLLRELQQVALLRATYSRHQLRETLADFWTNHFNIYAIKNDIRTLLPTDTERVLRPHLLGTFREMLFASAHSSAMMNYLDNQLNRKGVANENYARELLELHTLGVHSGYTLKDIQEVARCFTGWTVKQGMSLGISPFSMKQDLSRIQKDWSKAPDGFFYDSSRHDEGAKYIPFLNLTIIPNGGKRDAETVLEQLVKHPATARFLSQKLCRRYLGHAPDALVEKAAQAYLKRDTDIRAMLRPILLDNLPDPTQMQPLIKRPLDLAVSALRVLAADTDGGEGIQRHLADMGQPLYQWPMPDGFPEKASAWSGSMLPRWNFGFALTANAISGTSVDLEAPITTANAKGDKALLDKLMETVLSCPCDASEVQEVREKVGAHITKARKSAIPEATVLAEATGLLLASPAFQWK